MTHFYSFVFFFRYYIPKCVSAGGTTLQPPVVHDSEIVGEIWADRKCRWQAPAPQEPHHNPSSGQPHRVHARAWPICTSFKNGSANKWSKWASDISTDSTEAVLGLRCRRPKKVVILTARPFAMGTPTFAAFACGVKQRPIRWRNKNKDADGGRKGAALPSPRQALSWRLCCRGRPLRRNIH